MVSGYQVQRLLTPGCCFVSMERKESRERRLNAKECNTFAVMVEAYRTLAAPIHPCLPEYAMSLLFTPREAQSSADQPTQNHSEI